MRAKLRGILVILSALLCVMLIIEWPRSFWRSDAVGLVAAGGRLQAAGGYRGRVLIFLSDMPLDEGGGPRVLWHSADADDMEALFAGLYTHAPARPIERFGFLWARSEDSPLGAGMAGKHYILLGVPDALPIGLLVIAPLGWLRGRWRLHRRAKHGLCLRCGYDLRASPVRCPECGLEVTKGEGVPIGKGASLPTQ